MRASTRLPTGRRSPVPSQRSITCPWRRHGNAPATGSGQRRLSDRVHGADQSGRPGGNTDVVRQLECPRQRNRPITALPDGDRVTGASPPGPPSNAIALAVTPRRRCGGRHPPLTAAVRCRITRSRPADHWWIVDHCQRPAATDHRDHSRTGQRHRLHLCRHGDQLGRRRRGFAAVQYRGSRSGSVPPGRPRPNSRYAKRR